MLDLQMRGPFHRHGAATVIIGRHDLFLREAEHPEHVETRIVQLLIREAQLLLAELLAERVFVEGELNLERLPQPRLQTIQRRAVESLRLQRFVVDEGRSLEGPPAGAIDDDLLNLRLGISQRLQRRRQALVDDLEIAATRQLFELHQGEVRLDAGRVAVHDQADRAGRRDAGRLRIAEPIGRAQLQRPVPGTPRADEQLRGAVLWMYAHGLDGQPFVFFRRRVIGRPPMVSHDPQHVLAVFRIAVERA